MESRNPEIDQDRVADLFDTYQKYGYVMFPQQEKIYKEIAEQVESYDVIEAGCGNGVGSGILEQRCREILATDKSQPNLHFATKLYPWIEFEVWDINYRYDQTAEVVVAIEVFEHVANPQAAMDNLLAACTETLWLSTPNANVRKLPPDNPYHVWEYTPDEILKFVRESKSGDTLITIYDWETFEEVSLDTKCDPLVYCIRR